MFNIHEDLKACPFCDGAAELNIDFYHPESSYVACFWRNARTTIATPEKAIKLWNSWC